MPQFTEEVDYSNSDAPVGSTLRFYRVNPQQQNSFTVSTSQQPLDFVLPATAPYNLSRSYIEYLLSIPAQGNGNFSFAYIDKVPFDEISLFSPNGALLANVTPADVYSKVVRRACTSMVEYLGSGHSMNAATEVTQGAYTSGLQCADLPSAASAASTVGSYALNSGASAGATYSISNGGAGVHASEHISTSGDNTIQVLKYRIPLSAFKNTLFDVDKSLLYGGSCIIKVMHSPKDKFMSLGTAAANIATGAATLGTDATISKISLQLAQESNSLAIRHIQERVARQGLNLIVPYVYVSRNSFSGQSCSLQYQINNSAGLSLKAQFNTAILASDTLNTNSNTTNLPGDKVSLYNTYLDNYISSTENIEHSTTVSTWWKQQKDLYRDSPMSIMREGEISWCHTDMHTGHESCSAMAKDSGSDAGIALGSAGLVYNWNILTKSNANHLVLSYYVCSRVLRVDANGARFV